MKKSVSSVALPDTLNISWYPGLIGGGSTEGIGVGDGVGEGDWVGMVDGVEVGDTLDEDDVVCASDDRADALGVGRAPWIKPIVMIAAKRTVTNVTANLVFISVSSPAYCKGTHGTGNHCSKHY